MEVGHYFEGIDLVSDLSPVVHDMLSSPSLLGQDCMWLSSFLPGRVCINLSRPFRADADAGCMTLSVVVYNTALLFVHLLQLPGPARKPSVVACMDSRLLNLTCGNDPQVWMEEA